jgi:hypothetical protein
MAAGCAAIDRVHLYAGKARQASIGAASKHHNDGSTRSRVAVTLQVV